MSAGGHTTSAPAQSIAFIDLHAQRQRLGSRLEDAIARVLCHGAFIMGPEVEELEKKLAAFAGTKHCISCANGTDALTLVLMAEGVGRGDAVFVPAFTFVATAEVVALVGATPVFVDVVPDDFNMDPVSLESAIAWSEAAGLRPRVVIPVDLFGLPADYRRLASITSAHKLFMLCDAAQSFGAMLDGRRVGGFGHATSTSFFPSKPLGCYGDGGAVCTDDDNLADLARSLRVHGRSGNKCDSVRIGANSRLDTVQAAILIEKLAIFDEEIAARQRIADRYNSVFCDMARVPCPISGATPVSAQYTLVVADRAAIIARCQEAGIPTAIYYPVPVPLQTAYRQYPTVPGGVPVSEYLAKHVVSLPMHPYLDHYTQTRIIDAVQGALAQC